MFGRLFRSYSLRTARLLLVWLRASNAPKKGFAMSTYTPESRPSRWDAAKRVLLYIAAIAIVIWLFNIATQARSLAQSNAETVNVPIFQVAMVPGGPQRFNDEFEKALEARAEQGGEEAENLALEPADYLWMTLVVRNIGVESAR